MKRYGEHLTPLDVFERYIKPEVEKRLYDYIWTDMFAGEGNLIIPLLELVPEGHRVGFFRERVFLFDLQEKMVRKTALRLKKLGIPEEVVLKNVQVRDSIKEYPTFLFEKEYPVYHITNPPYMYLGQIAKEDGSLLEYFNGKFSGLQDLYQLAIINDLRHGVKKMIYILPTNFLFGDASSNAVRDALFPVYHLKKVYLFEKRIFSKTGIHTGMFFLERKEEPGKGKVVCPLIRVGQGHKSTELVLKPQDHYRASSGYRDFVLRYRALIPVRFSFYLTEKMLDEGEHSLKLLDVNSSSVVVRKVSEKVYRTVKSNLLFVRTIDTGSLKGRAGLYLVESLGVDGILAKMPYRTHPIQIFFNYELSREAQFLIKDYFNMVLEYLRDLTDGDFMTDFRYSRARYKRKYLGLKQVKEILETIPLQALKAENISGFRSALESGSIEEVMSFLRGIAGGKEKKGSL